MTEFDRPLCITAVNVSDMHVEPLGVSSAIKGRFALCDSRGKVYAFAISHKYSERTYKILDALYESMELDLVDILSVPGEHEGVEVHPSWEGMREPPDDDDAGMTFG